MNCNHYLHYPLLAFTALSAAQSSAQTHIQSAIVVIDTSNNAWHSQVHWLVYHVRLRIVRIRQNPLWLWNPEETSPEVQNRGISGPTNGHWLVGTPYLAIKASNVVPFFQF